MLLIADRTEQAKVRMRWANWEKSWENSCEGGWESWGGNGKWEGLEELEEWEEWEEMQEAGAMGAMGAREGRNLKERHTRVAALA